MPQPVTLKTDVERFYEDQQDLLQLTPPKYVIFIIGGWNAKVGSQEILGVTSKFGLAVQNEAGQRLIEYCQENALVIATPSSNNARLYTWTSPDGQHRNHIDYILCNQSEQFVSPPQTTILPFPISFSWGWS